MIGPARLMLAATGSGKGKTTMTCALLSALRQRGVRTAAFKCGPDYIDPMFHEKAIHTRSRNLDLFLMGKDAVLRSLCSNGSSAEICVLEGAMGYYDGIASTTEASAYAVAVETQSPVVLTIDCRGKGVHSVAAEIMGFLAYRQNSRIAGVLLNRLTSVLYSEYKICLERETGLPVLGFLPVLSECSLDSRHLGLVTADEVVGLQRKLELLADALLESTDMEALVNLARSVSTLNVPPLALPSSKAGVPIAIAMDRAFCFYYQDALELLKSLGAELRPFSPLSDHALPDGVCGVLLGGGYPELWARQLSENTRLLSNLKQKLMDGMPCIAECGGFMFLQSSLEGEDGRLYPMVNFLEGICRKTPRLRRFGYATLVARQDNLLCKKGGTLSAHEFHYWDSSAQGDGFTACKARRDTVWSAAVATDRLYAGYPHLHLCGAPDSADRFIQSCSKYQLERGLTP